MKKKPFGRRKVASAECELSVDHITITLAIQWRRLGAGMQRLASAGPQLQHERGGAYWQTKALQTLRLSPNSHLFPNRATTAKRLLCQQPFIPHDTTSQETSREGVLQHCVKTHKRREQDREECKVLRKTNGRAHARPLQVAGTSSV